jgi:hypothetical protein
LIVLDEGHCGTPFGEQGLTPAQLGAMTPPPGSRVMSTM